MQEMKYTATNDSVTVVWQGLPVTVKKGSPNFEGLRKAVLESNWDEVPFHLRADSSIERWTNGKFKVSNGVISYNGEKIPTDLNNRICEMAVGGQDPTPLMNFWERLQKNPSMRSVEQLWRFLNNSGHPITTDGHFLAYKGVRMDFKDCHSGTLDNRPGVVIELPRNKISDNPNTPCHYGLHVGALEYAIGFGQRVVICKVDPADVVCVPFDCSSQKMRVCRYEVIGLHGDGHLPSTTIDDDDLSDLDFEDDYFFDDDDFLEDFYPEDYRPLNDDVPPVEAKPVEKPLKVATPNGNRSKKLQALDKMDEADLMNLSYDELRKYASKGLGIIGASKILGGKWSLVSVIVKARP
jgi:hypothetical protein